MAVIRSMFARSNRSNSMCGALYLAIALFLNSLPLLADPAFQFHSIDKQQGLVSSVVYDIAQDHDGFMWFATEDGLQRYDGYEFVSYRHSRLDENSISSNVVRTVLVDSIGRVWVGTNNGLNLYSRKSDNFDRLNTEIDEKVDGYWHQILSISETKNGAIWTGSRSGLSEYSSLGVLIANYPQAKVRTIFEDKLNQLWIGTLGSGLLRFDRASKSFETLSVIKKNTTLSNKMNVIDIFQEASGKILIATWGSGLFTATEGARYIEEFKLDLPSDYVRSIFQDKEGKIWLGTSNGIIVFDTFSGKERVISADRTNKIAPNSNNIFKLFRADDGVIWVGTYGGGVSYHNPESRKFESFGQNDNVNAGLLDPVIFAISEDRSGNIWLGSEKGVLTLFDPVTEKFNNFELILDSSKFKDQITALLPLNKGTVLVGTQRGLYLFNLEQKKFSRYEDVSNNHINGGEAIRMIEQDSTGKIWVGFHESGIKIFDIGEQGALEEVFSIRIGSPQAWLDIGENKYVVGTDHNGLYQLELKDKKFLINSIPNTASLNVLDLELDSYGKIWIGTWSKGIKVLSSDGKFTDIDEDSGMPNNTIYSLKMDEITKNIWATTNMGMVAIETSDYNITKFSFHDGLQGNEFNRPGLLATSGHIYFGGVNGFTRFYPQQVRSSILHRKPVITGLSIANKSLKNLERDDFSDREHNDSSEGFVLKYDETPFAIAFTSPQFVKPQDIQYRYRLLGLDDRWVVSNFRLKKATYTNIDSGDYVFQVQSRIRKTEWSDTTISKNIEIKAPWWLTRLAFTLYTLAVCAVLGMIIYLQWKRRLSDLNSILVKEQSEERLRLSLWGGGNELWDWDIVKGDISRSDEATNISINCNSLSEGFSELNNYIHKYDIKRVKEQLRDHLRGRTEYFESVYRIKDSKLGWRWIQDRAKVVERDQNNRPTRMSGTQKDISEIQRKDEEIERLGQAFKTTSDGVWIRDAKWKLIEVNPSFEKITGFTFDEKKGEELWFPEHADQTANIIQRIRLSLMEKGHWQGEVWAERKNEDPFPQKLTIDTILDEKGHACYYVGVFSDNTFQKRAEDEFRKLANFDSLTGLPNRACLYDRLNQTIEKTRIRRERFALFVVDIDNFKRINDSMGHSVGDTLISEVAMRLTHCNRDGDTIARIGGDEFVIIRDDIQSSTEIASFAEKMLVELNEPIFVKGQKLSLNFSIGITISPDDGASAEKLLRNADTAMYEAKKDVQNSFHFYSIDLNQKARKRLAMENELRRAVEFDLFDVVYQPKVNMETGTVLGMEALARWVHPKLGNISPDEFIPLAESTGLIIELGNQILRKAIAETKRWVDLGLMKGKMSVNLSAHQFLQEDLPNQVMEILTNEGLETEYLELELTESAFIQDLDLTIKQMNQLRKLGIHLALDDFGTGYSSLAQLKTLPLDTLKIDKSFIQNIADSSKDLNVVKAIIDIGKSLDLSIVIEGVESKLQCDKLWQCRANIIQGFFFSKPVKRTAMTKLLEKKWERSAYLSKISDNVTSLG